MEDYLSKLPSEIGCKVIDQLDFNWKRELLSANKPLHEMANECITSLESEYWTIIPLTGLGKLRRLRKLDHVLIGVTNVVDLGLLDSLVQLEEYNLLVQIRSLVELSWLSLVLSDPRLKELILQTQLSPVKVIQYYKELTQRPVKVYMDTPHYSWVTPIYKQPGFLYVYYPDTNQMYYWTLDQTTEVFVNNSVGFDQFKDGSIHGILNPTFREEIFKGMKMGLKNPKQPPSDSNHDLKNLPEIRDQNWWFEYLDAYEIPIILNNWKVNIDEDSAGRLLLTTIGSVERQTLDYFRFPDSYDYEHEESGETEEQDKLTVSFDLYEYRNAKMIDSLDRQHPWSIFDLLLLKDPRTKSNRLMMNRIVATYRELATNGGVWYNVDSEQQVLE